MEKNKTQSHHVMLLDKSRQYDTMQTQKPDRYTEMAWRNWWHIPYKDDWRDVR